jgi:hypothetical protein
LAVAAEGRTPALLLRPWKVADMPGLLAAMDREYPARTVAGRAAIGLRSRSLISRVARLARSA